MKLRSLKGSFLLDKWINLPHNKVEPINQFDSRTWFSRVSSCRPPRGTRTGSHTRGSRWSAAPVCQLAHTALSGGRDLEIHILRNGRLYWMVCSAPGGKLTIWQLSECCVWKRLIVLFTQKAQTALVIDKLFQVRWSLIMKAERDLCLWKLSLYCGGKKHVV